LGTQVYVALDLETTGLDTETDSIIEIGAVRFDESGVLGSFETLVNPGRPVSATVLDLTGIREDGIDGAPPLAAVAAELEEFLGDSALVGHNVIGFDTVFLQRAGIAHSPVVLDTQEIASLVMPGQAEYGQAALAATLGIEVTTVHRALADAETSRRLFLALMRRAADLPTGVLSQVAEWLVPTEYPWRPFFARAWERAVDKGGGSRTFSLSAPPLPPPLTPVKDPCVVPPEESVRALASAADLVDVFPGWEEREEQARMASAVASAMGEGKHLIVEAGTGTGKSLAYLLPAALQAVANGERVVVSTATINLQEQLTGKDIPAMERLVGGEGRGKAEGGIRACQLKGRRNYLCLRQFDALKSEVVMGDAEALIASRILIWLCQTETGDRSELRMRPEEETLWRTLSADNLACNADTSPYVVEGTCFLRRARKQAEGSHIVVVNHSLLLSDAAMGGGVLPPYEHLVVDEAHHLEDEATRQFGFQGRDRDVFDLLGRCDDVSKGVHDRVRGAAGTVALAPFPELAGVTSNLQAGADGARKRLTEFTQVCSTFMSEHAFDGGEYEQRLHIQRAMRVQPDWPGVEVAWDNLRLRLTEVAVALEALVGLLSGEGFKFLNQELLVAEVGGLLTDVRGYLAGFAGAIETDDAQKVVWFEQDHDMKNASGLIVSWVPLTVDNLLQERVYADRKSVVLAGATLSSGAGTQGAGSGFAYIQERLGLEDAETLALGSPFDYRRAALLLLPKDMPEPNWPEYNDALARAVIDLSRASQGRALVLFTSHSSLRSVHGMVSEPLRREGIAVLGQGIDGSPRQLVRALLARPDTVLLGTSSFWEGVDLAGDALSLLVIAKLPFGVPTEPVTAARSALYDDPFTQYTVPQAVLRFKQGFGRLIRRKTDRGVVAVLDRRILSKQYGQVFTSALPPCTVRPAMVREMPGLVGEWLARVASGERQR
jgi:DNA polymerase-3 subunit epsilon/ATP-dependent DNA helicase DinG